LRIYWAGQRLGQRRIRERDAPIGNNTPGKINFTDADNALNILKYLMDRPAPPS